jgi:NAD(P)-dependent dehydrogenase (short-subunit alcohol dehydrogenase family)
MNDMRLKKLIGKWALVTGGSRGIGKAICLELAKEGASIVVNYVSNNEAADRIVKEIRVLGVDAYKIRTDVSDRNQVQNMVNDITKNNPIDILVNNAGIVEFQSFLEITPESWDKIFKTNLFGAFNVCQLVTREMVKRKKGGKIVMISSINQDIPNLQQGVYSITKSGLKMLAMIMALELSSYKINVNLIASGAVPTDINKQQIIRFPGCVERYSNVTPLGRWGKPEEIAHAAVFLSTSPDSDYITGSTIYVEGGIMINNCWAQNRVD